MTLEAILAYLHIAALLTAVVFISSEASLCRADWMNAKVVERLVRVDTIYLIGLASILVTGLARTWWGVKGAGWYWSNGLLHLKLGLYIAVVLMAIKPARMLRRWRDALRADGSLPGDAEVREARKWMMIAGHLIALIPLAAVFLARGFG
jgi:putative membrane protein